MFYYIYAFPCIIADDIAKTTLKSYYTANEIHENVELYASIEKKLPNIINVNKMYRCIASRNSWKVFIVFI